VDTGTGAGVVREMNLGYEFREFFTDETGNRRWALWKQVAIRYERFLVILRAHGFRVLVRALRDIRVPFLSCVDRMGLWYTRRRLLLHLSATAVGKTFRAPGRVGEWASR
jgi:hypothetical protein